MKYSTLPHFTRKFDDYPKADQEIILETLKGIKEYLETSKASYGLRIKRLCKNIYEGRIDIHHRIAFYRKRDIVKFFCLGNHEDISRCLKRLESIAF